MIHSKTFLLSKEISANSYKLLLLATNYKINNGFE